MGDEGAEPRGRRAPEGDFGQLLAEGEKLLDAGRPEEAEQKLRAAAARRPDDAYVHNKLGVSCAQQGRLEEARRYFSEALRLDPSFAPAHSNMGNVHREAGRLEEAVQSYLEALRHDPDYYVAHHNLGAAYRRQGRIADAVHHLKRANRLEKQFLRSEARRRGGGRLSWPTVLFWIAVGAVLLWLLRGG